MNTQELFESLASLEKELGNIKSARILAEETITSYRDAQKEIARLLDGLLEADARLATIGKAFETQNITLSEKLQEGVENIHARLDIIGNDFKAKCDNSGSEFSDRVKAAIDDLKMESGAIVNEFAAENARFKDNVDILDFIHQGLEKMGEAIRGLDEKLAGHREKLDELQKDAGEKAQKTRIYIAENHHILMDRLDGLQQNLDERTENLLAVLSADNGSQLEKLEATGQFLEAMDGKFGSFQKNTENLLAVLSANNGSQLEKLEATGQFLETMDVKFSSFQKKMEEMQRNGAEKAQNILSSIEGGNEAHMEKLASIQQNLEARVKNIEEQNRRHRDNLLEKINVLKASTEEKIQKTIAYIAEINLNNSTRMKGLQKSTEEKLEEIETLLGEERKKREEDQAAMLNSGKRIQTWLIILLVMTALLLVYPFVEKYMRI